jgi:hypothetical protein
MPTTTVILSSGTASATHTNDLHFSCLEKAKFKNTIIGDPHHFVV